MAEDKPLKFTWGQLNKSHGLGNKPEEAPVLRTASGLARTPSTGEEAESHTISSFLHNKKFSRYKSDDVSPETEIEPVKTASGDVVRVGSAKRVLHPYGDEEDATDFYKQAVAAGSKARSHWEANIAASKKEKAAVQHAVPSVVGNVNTAHAEYLKNKRAAQAATSQGLASLDFPSIAGPHSASFDTETKEVTPHPDYNKVGAIFAPALDFERKAAKATPKGGSVADTAADLTAAGRRPPATNRPSITEPGKEPQVSRGAGANLPSSTFTAVTQGDVGTTGIPNRRLRRQMAGGGGGAPSRGISLTQRLAHAARSAQATQDQENAVKVASGGAPSTAKPDTVKALGQATVKSEPIDPTSVKERPDQIADREAIELSRQEREAKKKASEPVAPPAAPKKKNLVGPTGAEITGTIPKNIYANPARGASGGYTPEFHAEVDTMLAAGIPKISTDRKAVTYSKEDMPKEGSQPETPTAEPTKKISQGTKLKREKVAQHKGLKANAVPVRQSRAFAAEPLVGPSELETRGREQKASELAFQKKATATGAENATKNAPTPDRRPNAPIIALHKKLQKFMPTRTPAGERIAGLLPPAKKNESFSNLVTSMTSSIRRLWEREFSQPKRKKLAKKGSAMKDGSFPIENEKDLKNAERAVGRAHPSKRAAVRAHIRKRAAALGVSLKGSASEA